MHPGLVSDVVNTAVKWLEAGGEGVNILGHSIGGAIVARAYEVMSRTSYHIMRKNKTPRGMPAAGPAEPSAGPAEPSEPSSSGTNTELPQPQPQDSEAHDSVHTSPKRSLWQRLTARSAPVGKNGDAPVDMADGSVTKVGPIGDSGDGAVLGGFSWKGLFGSKADDPVQATDGSAADAHYCNRLPINFYTFGSLYVPPADASTPTTLVNMTHYLFSNDEHAMLCNGLAEGDGRATWIGQHNADSWAVHTSYPSTAQWAAARTNGDFLRCGGV